MTTPDWRPGMGRGEVGADSQSARSDRFVVQATKQLARLVAVAAAATLMVAPSATKAAATLRVTPHARQAKAVAAAELVRMVSAGETVDLAGLEIRGDLDLRPVGTASQTIRCIDCQFDGDVLLSDVIFERTVDLSGAHLAGALLAERSQFNGPFLLRSSVERGATVGTGSSFALAEFGSQANFDGATFLGAPSFEAARFDDAASFVGTNFAEGVNFELARFGADALFSADRQTSVAPSSVPNPCNSQLVGTVGGAANFARTTFEGHTDFRQRCFAGAAAFRWSTFDGMTDFAQTVFHESASFERCTFGGPASFELTEFDGPARFDFSTGGSIDFSGAVLGPSMSLFGLSASGTLSLDDVRFSLGLDLRRLEAGGLQMAVEAVDTINSPLNRKELLRMIERSARERGDLFTANAAQYRLLELEGQDLSGLSSMGDLAYRTFAGYLVRPVNPFFWFFVLLLIGIGVRSVARRLGIGVRSVARRRPSAAEKGPPESHNDDTQGRAIAEGTPVASKSPGAAIRVGDGINRLATAVVSTLRTAFKLSPNVQVQGTWPSLGLGALRFIEYAGHKVLILSFLLGLGNSNPTIRQFVEAVLP